MFDSPLIFDRKRVVQHRDRAADDFNRYDFLIRAAAERLVDRLDDTTRRFPFALDIGSHTGQLQQMLAGRGGIRTLISTELSEALLRKNDADLRVVADEEYLPFAPESFDLALSALSLHWVNDLPGALLQIRRSLKQDGLFLAIVFGGQTLKELRISLELAMLEIEGGIAANISPFVDVRDAGNLLQRAGFTLPVVDMESLTVTYDTIFSLMEDLRGMGESNALIHARKQFTRRSVFERAAEIYHEQFLDDEGRLIATFEFLTLTAWAPHHSQQKPAARGSGQINLNRVFMMPKK